MLGQTVGFRNGVIMILLNALIRPAGKTDKTNYFHTEESDFYDSYRAHLDIADLLAGSQLYWDAVYHLNFSVECFMKYAFCLTRKSLLQITNANQVSQFLNDWKAQHPFLNKKYLYAANFSHDLKSLRLFFEAQTDAKNYSEFRDLATHLPSDTKWVDDRYKSRVHTHYQSKFTDYRKDFNAFLNAPFQGVQ